MAMAQGASDRTRRQVLIVAALAVVETGRERA